VFRVTLSVTDIGRQLAESAARLGVKRVAIQYARTDYGQDLSNAFEARATELGLKVPVRRSYEASDSIDEPAIRTTMREWANLEIDAVFLAGEPPTAAQIVVMIRRAGLRLPLFAGDAMSSPEVIKVAGAAAEGIVVASFFHPDEPRPEVTAFTRAFKERYGMTPDVGSALGYDAVRLLVHAMREGGSAAPERIADVLHRTRDWRGVTGAFTFDDRGETVGKRLIQVEVRGGRFVFAGQRASATVALAAEAR
jgi:branched-chain amino acid transport system substrate-binding protein